VHWDGVNIVARRDGLVHVGSKHDDHGFTAHPTPEGRHWLLERLQTVLPGFKAEVAEARAGLASSTPAKIPLLGPLPDFDTVYVAAPSTNGFLLSAVLAHILTDLFVHGKQHPLLPMLSPAQAQARAAGR
jgi:glycine/D-amino acid oxidase-like deaminating enzyme